MMKSEDDNKSENNEPEAFYANKQMRFFNSFEEMSEENYRELASFTPVEHLAHATELIKGIFADKIKEQEDCDNRITFS